MSQNSIKGMICLILSFNIPKEFFLSLDMYSKYFISTLFLYFYSSSYVAYYKVLMISIYIYYRDYRRVETT